MITKKYLQQELAKRIDGYKRGVETSTDNIIAEMKSILVLVDALPDYEKKYNEALKRAKAAIDIAADKELVKGVASTIFPELRESEDERARKAALEGIEYLERELGWDAIGDTDILDVKEYLEKQKEQNPEFPKPHKGDDTNPYDMSVSEAQEYAINRGFGIPFNDGEVYVDERHLTQTIGNILRWADEHPKEQKPAEKQDYSGLNDLERAIHRGFLSAGVENVSITIIKETARECLAQMNPAEWNDTDMKEARNSLISVCRDWECGKQTTLLPLAAVRARYFLEHLTEPEPAECIEDSVKFEEGFKTGRESGLRDGQKYVLDNAESYGLCKPAEWSEEDERRIDAICELLENTSAIHPNYSRRKLIIWLKSLRHSWKPSEEQMKALQNAVALTACDKELARLYNQLKKL